MAVTLDDVCAVVERLVGFDSVSRNSNLDLIDYLQGYLARHGIPSELVMSDDRSKANLFATLGPWVPGGVILSGHTDVVPVDGQPWKSDPFRLVRRDERLYGRGTSDMKTFIAIALALVPEMKTLKRPIHLAFSYDEEVGCRGAPRMIERMSHVLPAPMAVIVGEPTEMRVVSAHKGITVARTTVHGHEAHSSQTHRGVSAVAVAARLIAYLDDLGRERSGEGPFALGFDPPHSTVHVGLVRGGTAVNIIARECVFEWDIRSIPGDPPESVLSRFDAHCQDQVIPAMRAVAPAAGITTQVLMQAPALAHEARNPAIDLACRLTRTDNPGKVPFAAEAGLFQQAGFPTVICGPGSIDQAHQPDEFITLEQVQAGLDFQRHLVAELS